MHNHNHDEIPSGRKVILYIVVLAIIFTGLDWVAQGNNFFMYKFFAPKQEAVHRQVYEGTKSYHQGSIQRLNTLCEQVNSADYDHAIMLRDIIKQEFAEWDINDVPVYLHPCINNARK